MRRRKGFYEACIKRPLDFVCALGGIIVLSPVMLITAGFVKVKLGSPVIFKQERPGKGEKIFKLYKFRTMTDDKDINGELLSNEERMTPFGEKLRRTSLDELPELFNILKGDMSIIGPRPLLTKYLPLYNDEQRKRHLVRPGLTGLAQVNGRNHLTWDEKFRLDTLYVKQLSFRMDIQIFLKTIATVLKREGITSETSVTMEPFEGNNKQ